MITAISPRQLLRPFRASRSAAATLHCLILVVMTGDLVGQSTWKSPQNRAYFGAAIDSTRSELTVFGGTAGAGAPLADTWQLDASLTWVERTSATSPDGRLNPAVAATTTAVPGKLILFGGKAPDGLRDDTWRWDGKGWGQEGPNQKPARREKSAMAFDPTRNKMLLFGGLGESGPLGDTWEWDVATSQWQNVTPSNPPSPRFGHAMTFNERVGLMVLSCGQTATGVLGDLWTYSAATKAWTLLSSAIPARSEHSFGYHKGAQKLAVFGGKDTNGQVLGDTWSADLSMTSWSSSTGGGSEPPPSAGHAMTYLPSVGDLVLTGGININGEVLPEQWRLEIQSAKAKWSLLQDSPDMRSNPVFEYDTIRQRALLFGGTRNSSHLSDMWAWDGQKWSRLSASGRIPARSEACSAFDSGRGMLVVFGGDSVSGRLRDTWEFNGTNAWVQRAGASGPLATYNQGMVYDEMRQECVWIGGDGTSLETWTWNGSAWTQRASLPSLGYPRKGFALGYDPVRGRTVLNGGVGGGILITLYYNDTWEWDGVGWTKAAPPNVPKHRWNHRLVFDPISGRLVSVGGIGLASTTEPMLNLWEWNGVNWLQTAALSGGVPRALYGMTCDRAHERIVAYGGLKTVADLWTLYRLAPASFEPDPARPGCGKPSSVPRLEAEANALPWIGDELRLRIIRPAGTTAACALGFSDTVWGALSLPLSLDGIGMTQCRLHVSPDLPWLYTNAESVALPLPFMPALIGGFFFTQAFVLDPQANALGVSASNSARATLGLR